MNETSSNPPSLHLTAQLAPARVLVVDDEDALRRAFARILEAAGHVVSQAQNGREARDAIEGQAFDVIVSDISMPELDGIGLLRAVRARDLDVPVILVTANPSVDSAAAALELGAVRYLVKPVPAEELVKAVAHAERLHRMARLRREAAEYVGATDRFLGDRAGLEVSFRRALDSLWMAFQPIVHLRHRRIEAYEALVRTREPSIPHPGALLAAAETLGELRRLGRTIREAVASNLRVAFPEGDVFVNLHSDDLMDDLLASPAGPLAPYRERVVFEITERAALGHTDVVSARVAALRREGYRIAIDDLGAGYAGLNYFALLSPDVAKLDMTLIRGVDADPVKQKLVRSMVGLCRDLGIRVVAEGVETTAERDALTDLGCSRMQGYLFARPGPAYPTVTF